MYIGYLKDKKDGNFRSVRKAPFQQKRFYTYYLSCILLLSIAEKSVFLGFYLDDLCLHKG